MKGGLIPFPHQGDNPFSADTDTWKSWFPSRPLSMAHLDGSRSPPPSGSRGPLSSLGRSSGRGWAQGPAQQPSRRTQPAWEGQSGPSVIQQTSLGSRPPACSDMAPGLGKGHWPQRPHSSHVKERGRWEAGMMKVVCGNPGTNLPREDGASVLTPDTERPVLSWRALGCG